MTDIILSSLLNLFALFCRKGEVDVAASRRVLIAYLHRHFGIRNTDEWLEMYDSLTEVYALSPDIDTNSVVDGICENLHGRISQTEETLMVLRLMEFCGVDGLNETERRMLEGMAQRFHVDNETYNDFFNFVLANDGGNVHIEPLNDGVLKTLFIQKLNALVFSFTGQDELLLNDVPVLSGTFQIMQKSGVLKPKNHLPLYYSTLRGAIASSGSKGSNGSNGSSADGVFQNGSIVFAGRGVDFRFPNSDNGTHNFSFTLKSGTLLAIMGGSGAGKTTLLNLLNGSVKPQKGSITINGHSIEEEEVKKMIGFVPQDDLLVEELTVRENLWFTARLCFEGLSKREIDERVDRTLRDLGLEATADLMVGSPLNKTISGGQRKRLNIALELIREPAVLFLDEPTSGLSSSDTEMVINLLKEQTYQGRLIVVNIHQPSSDVYKLFDRLWLLDRGGYPVYDGNPIDAITYFKRAASYADAETSMCPVCGNLNPEVVLNIIDEKALDSTGMMSQERKVTPQQWNELYMRDRAERCDDVEVIRQTGIPETKQRHPSALKQFCIFLQRNIRTKITNRQYLLITGVVSPLLAVICAWLTRYAPETGYTLMENKNFPSYMFMAVIVATFLGMSSTAEEIIHERALLKREKFLRLNYCSYIMSKIVYAAGISLVQTALFVLVGNSIMGVHCLFMTWWGVLFAVSLLSNMIGLLLSQSMGSIVSIYITIPLLLIPQILLCGVVVDFRDLTPNSTTGNVPLIGNVIPSRWAYEALAVENFSNNDFEKTYFPFERQKYETQYYSNAFLYEMESQIETLRDERAKHRVGRVDHLDVVRKNLPVMEAYTGMKPYCGDYGYRSLHEYFMATQRVLDSLGNVATLAADKIMSDIIRCSSREEQTLLKQRMTNNQLRDMVMNIHSSQALRVVDGRIVPQVGTVFLTPLTRCGNAPFYSCVKLVGNAEVETFWFNLGVLYLMCIVLAGVLLSGVVEKKN